MLGLLLSSQPHSVAPFLAVPDLPFVVVADISLAHAHWNAIYYQVMQDIHSHHVLRARGNYEDGVNTSSSCGYNLEVTGSQLVDFDLFC